jgi:hypothetical protein
VWWLLETAIVLVGVVAHINESDITTTTCGRPSAAFDPPPCALRSICRPPKRNRSDAVCCSFMIPRETTPLLPAVLSKKTRRITDDQPPEKTKKMRFANADEKSCHDPGRRCGVRSTCDDDGQVFCCEVLFLASTHSYLRSLSFSRFRYIPCSI